MHSTVTGHKAHEPVNIHFKGLQKADAPNCLCCTRPDKWRLEQEAGTVSLLYIITEIVLPAGSYSLLIPSGDASVNSCFLLVSM